VIADRAPQVLLARVRLAVQSEIAAPKRLTMESAPEGVKILVGYKNALGY
jgi:hypothetical protein